MSGHVHIYTRKAELFHLPIVRIIKASIPAWNAAVAVPVCKLIYDGVDPKLEGPLKNIG